MLSKSGIVFLESHFKEGLLITVEVSLGNQEYRYVGGEVHRRPIEREGLSAWNAAWLVIRRDEMPQLIRKLLFAEFEQALSLKAVN